MSGDIKQSRRVPLDKWQSYPHSFEVMVLNHQIHAFLHIKSARAKLAEWHPKWWMTIKKTMVNLESMKPGFMVYQVSCSSCVNFHLW